MRLKSLICKGENMEKAKATKVPEYVFAFSMTIDSVEDGTGIIVEDNKGQSWLVIRDGNTIKLYIKK